MNRDLLRKIFFLQHQSVLCNGKFYFLVWSDGADLSGRFYRGVAGHRSERQSTNHPTLQCSLQKISRKDGKAHFDFVSAKFRNGSDTFDHAVSCAVTNLRRVIKETSTIAKQRYMSGVVLVWPGLVWYWSGLVWSGLVWYWSGLVWYWSGLVSSGVVLVWYWSGIGLAWSDHVPFSGATEFSYFYDMIYCTSITVWRFSMWSILALHHRGVATITRPGCLLPIGDISVNRATAAATNQPWPNRMRNWMLTRWTDIFQPCYTVYHRAIVHG